MSRALACALHFGVAARLLAQTGRGHRRGCAHHIQPQLLFWYDRSTHTCMHKHARTPATCVPCICRLRTAGATCALELTACVDAQALESVLASRTSGSSLQGAAAAVPIHADAGHGLAEARERAGHGLLSPLAAEAAPPAPACPGRAPQGGAGRGTPGEQHNEHASGAAANSSDAAGADGALASCGTHDGGCGPSTVPDLLPLDCIIILRVVS